MKTAIEKLYDLIPSMECLKNCTDCCGPVPFSKEEWDRVKDKRKGNILFGCPYVEKGKCDIYNVRPSELYYSCSVLMVAIQILCCLASKGLFSPESILN